MSEIVRSELVDRLAPAQVIVIASNGSRLCRGQMNIGHASHKAESVGGSGEAEAADIATICQFRDSQLWFHIHPHEESFCRVPAFSIV